MKKQSMIKTKILLAACTCLLTAMPGGMPRQQVTAEAAQNTISEEEANVIVFMDAGLEDSKIRKYKVKLEGKKKKKEYEIRFVSGDFKYKYELDAYSGKIKEKDLDRISISSTDASKDIGKDTAKSIALRAAGVKESDVSNLKVKQKKENNFKVYAVEFETSAYEYEYEIDVYTGKILEEDLEAVN